MVRLRVDIHLEGHQDVLRKVLSRQIEQTIGDPGGIKLIGLATTGLPKATFVALTSDERVVKLETHSLPTIISLGSTHPELRKLIGSKIKEARVTEGASSSLQLPA